MKNLILFITILFTSVTFIKAQTCATQDDGSVDILFTVPPNVGIGMVSIYFDFDGLGTNSHITADQIEIDPPGTDYGIYDFTAFFPSAGHSHTYSDLLLSYGYTVLLDDVATDEFRIDIGRTGVGEWNNYDPVGAWVVTIDTIEDHVTHLPVPYVINITNITGNGTSDPEVTECTPCNQAPTVEGIAPALSTTTPLEVSFEAVNPDDDGTFELIWNFGDSQTGSGNPVAHTYASDGEYTVDYPWSGYR